MCGIVGVVGNDRASEVILDGLSVLESRGYDSAGIATISSAGDLHITKFASGNDGQAIARLREHVQSHTGDAYGIGHTRWATHGGKTDINAHPHWDEKRRVALVHNGVIENVSALRKRLTDRGITCRSQTDTEVIVQTMGVFLDEGADVETAMKRTVRLLEGTWGLVCVSPLVPQTVFAARLGSPLVVGLGKGEMYIASEPAAFSRYTREYIALQNGECARITPEGSSLDVSRVEQAPEEQIERTPDPYPHWTLKEIHEQAEACERVLNYGARIPTDRSVKLGGLDRHERMLLGIRHLVIAACGTSYHAGLYGAHLMRQLGAFETVQVVDAAELVAEQLLTEGVGVLVVSQSGETKDVQNAVVLAQQMGKPTFSVINAVGSLIARTTKCGVYLNAGREQAVASTKAFSTQVMALALIGAWFNERREGNVLVRKQILASVRRVPAMMKTVIQTHATCIRLAASLKDKEHMFLLGKGLAESVAREGALKIKELGYVHAEGYPGGALKHGPFALIEEGTPVVMFILDDQEAHRMRTAAQEVRARGARTIIITDHPRLAEGIADETITIPSSGNMTALLANVPMQLLAYELALQRGTNPDRPRNLAKAVTVD